MNAIASEKSRGRKRSACGGRRDHRGGDTPASRGLAAAGICLLLLAGCSGEPPDPGDSAALKDEAFGRLSGKVTGLSVPAWIIPNIALSVKQDGRGNHGQSGRRFPYSRQSGKTLSPIASVRF